MKKENMLLAALCFGNKKPVMSTFLKPISEALKQLAAGIQCYAPRIGHFLSKGFLMCFTADLPARSLTCNSIQYNGAFSCWKCLQPGKSAQSGKGHAHIFPFNKEDPKGPLRTPESILEDAAKATNNSLEKKTKNVVSRGVKGPSWFILFPKFHIIQGVAIDYMHRVLLGVQKLLLRLWFAPEFAKEQFSFHKIVGKADKFLGSIRPTLDVSRLPRSIEKDLRYWKASEFRSFLLLYGPSVMFGILDCERFSHYLLLVQAMHILLKAGSSDSEIDFAEKMIYKFCDDFLTYYHEKFMTLNIHQLLHLPDSVRQLGPLYTHSCFSFEDKNGVILKLIKGTQSIDSQITTGVSFIQKLPELKQTCIAKDSKEETVYKSIENPYMLKRTMKLTDKVYVLGCIKEATVSAEELCAISDFLGEVGTNDKFQIFNRAEIEGFIVYGLKYKRMSKRDNATICYQSGHSSCENFGRVRFFIYNLNESENVAVLEVLEYEGLNDSCIMAVKAVKKLKIVPLKDIKYGCLFIPSENSQTGFVCKFPNRKECD